jgi:hypothetical protein
LAIVTLLLAACVIQPLPQTDAAPAGEEEIAETAVEATGTPTPVPEPTATPGPPPERILFIGSSLTYSNMGVDEHLKVMAASSEPPLIIETKADTIGGAILKVHWESGGAQEAIREGDWDVVVLQESPHRLEGPDDVHTFYEYARRFDQEIKNAGARTLLYMTWETPHADWIDTDTIVAAHRHIAEELGAEVSPAGMAWKRAVEQRPDLNLYDRDRVHPSILGTYLTVNVLFATLFERTPVGHSYRPPDIYPDPDSVAKAQKGYFQRLRDEYEISDEDAEFLQRVAWETVLEYQVGQ